MALVSLADLKLWLNEEDTQHDAVLTDLEQSVVTWLETECRRPFLQETAERIVPSSGGEELVLPFPVLDATPSSTTTWWTREDLTDSWSTIANADLEFRDIRDGRTTVLTLVDGSEWPDGRQLVKGNWETGYDETNVKTKAADLGRAVKTIAGIWWQRRTMMEDVLEVESDLSANLPPDVLTTINSYRTAVDDGFSTGSSVKKIGRHSAVL